MDPTDAAPGPLLEAIDALLPQTQCGRCGYTGCLPYAVALSRAEADINRCPPGGAPLIAALARLLERKELPLDPACGSSPSDIPDAVAHIDPEACIGCALCLPPCPVDAILGAARHLHTVITTDCTGCALCLPACPVDCIVMTPRSAGEGAPTSAQNRARYRGHRSRQAGRQREQSGLIAERKRAARNPGPE